MLDPRLRRLALAAHGASGHAQNRLSDRLLPAVLTKQHTKQNIIVEYSSPNLAKPFHIGHLRGTEHGQFVCNILRAAGHKVTSLNWLGDWGVQFSLLERAWQLWPDVDALQGDTHSALLYLHQLYVRANTKADQDPVFNREAHRLFQTMDETAVHSDPLTSDSPVFDFWKKVRNISLIEFEKLYAELNVHFDEQHSESMYAAQSKTLVKHLLQTGVAEQSEGSVVVRVGEKEVAPLLKSDGSTLYLTRDVTAALHRLDTYQPDRMLYVVDNHQTDHFINVQKVLCLIRGQAAADTIEHLKTGIVQGMSSRQGRVIYAHDLFEHGNKTLTSIVKSNVLKSGLPLHQIKPVVRCLGLASIKLHLLRERRSANYEFSMGNKSMFRIRDSGVYVQQANAMLCSLLRTFANELDTDIHTQSTNQLSDQILIDCFNNSGHTTLEDVPIIEQLTNRLYEYESVLAQCEQQLQPCHLVQYLFALAGDSRAAFANLRVKGQTEQERTRRLALFRLCRDVLTDAMHLLGIQPLVRG